MTIKLAEVAYSSEWFLAKLCRVLKDELISDVFQLVSVAGRQDTKQEAIERIRVLKAEREKSSAQDYGARNTSAELQSLGELERGLAEGSLEYHPIIKKSEGVSLTDEMFLGCNALYVSSLNETHIDFAEEALRRNIPILVEKPTCVVLDKNGEANSDQLNRLEEIAAKDSGQFVFMDAEHYSYKPVSMNFYRNIETLLRGREIVGARGRIIEHDDPNKIRVRNLLKKSSQTGLLTDTGVHLLSFVSNLGYNAKPKEAKHNIFPGYDVETGSRASYEILSCSETKKRFVREGARFELHIEKFGQHSTSPEAKEMMFILSDGTSLVLDFTRKDGAIIERNYSTDGLVGAEVIHPLTRGASSSEYVNILNEFKAAIGDFSKKPLTDYRNSIRTMNALYQTYKVFPVTDSANVNREAYAK